MSKRSFRVFLATLEDERLVGVLMRRVDRLFDDPPPSAFGRTREEVFRQLETAAFELEAEADDDLDRYLWTETFATRRVEVEVHAATSVGMRPVIGKRRLPLRVTFAYCPLDGGGFRVMLPRFGWWFVLEDLSIARKVVERAIATALLGQKPTWVFDFRYRGEETVVEWEPDVLARRVASSVDHDTDDESLLYKVAEEWVTKAERKRLPQLVGSDAVFDANAALFERNPLPSLLLVGPSGAGKTSFVVRLARHLLARRRGKKGEGRRYTQLWASSADHIVAGMVYLGMWQDRVLKIVEALSHEGDYLYVDRLPSLMAAQSDGASIADLLAPAVAAGEISLLAECDERELIRCRQRNSSFVDCFRLVRLAESPASTLVPLLELYLARSAVDFTLRPGALVRAVAHLGSFRRDTVFPGKAFQFVDWLIRDSADKSSVTLDPRGMSEAFSRYSGLPVELISDDVPKGAVAISEELARGVVGQTHACDTVARSIARFKAGLDDPERPVATLFFAGPTGVGKTELAKQLARYLFGDAERMIRVDMSEYMVSGSAQRLLDSGPAVTSLAERVRRYPLSLVLLDEIEKAHPEVYDVLLGVLGEGRLTDSAGRLVDFRMTVTVMTSNLGARKTERAGFGDGIGGDYLGAVRRHFRPEFFNRIDHVIEFRPLDQQSVERIVDLEIAKVGQRVGLRRRGLTLRLTQSARLRLATLGYDPQLGARVLKRVIEDRIVAPLAVRLSADPRLESRDIVIATHVDDVVGDLMV